MLDLVNDSRFAATAQLYLKYLALIPAAVVVAALYFGRPVLLPVAIAVLLAFAIAPFCTGLRRIGLGRMWSVFIASFISIAFIVGIGVFVATKTVQLADQLPLYQNNLVQKIQSIRGTADETSVLGRAAAMMKMLREQVVGGSTTISATSPTPPGAAQSPNTGTVAVEIKQPDIAPLEIAASFMARLFSFLMAAGIIIVFVVFILLYKEDIRDRFIRLAGSRDLQRTALLLDEGAERLGRYLLTQTAINAAFGLLIAAGLWLIGLPNPELWGITVMIFRFVPYIGVPLAAIFPVVLALAVDPGWSMAISSFALFFVGEFIFGQAVEPVLYGRGLGLSPAAVIISATFWTWLWGPVGLLLSTPLTLCLVVLGHHVPHLQFLDVLFGDQPALSAEEALYIRILGDDADEAAAEAESVIKENSLAHYYNEVVLKALLIAQADINRGALDTERVAKIRETTRGLIENLSDVEADDGGAHAGESISPEKTVLCIGGRGPLDEAAALLLMHLLQRAGVPARLASKEEGSDSNVYQLDNLGAKTVCLCYLDPGNINRARYILRRLKRRNPDVVAIAAFWGFPHDGAEAAETIGCGVVTKFDEAVESIIAAVKAAPPRSEAA